MIDEKKLIEDLKEWQQRLRANGDDFADITDTMIDVVISKIESQPKADRWIPIEEKKPEIGQLIIVWFNYGTADDPQRGSLLFMGEFDGFGWDGDQKIVAWQPFPDLYTPGKPRSLPDTWIEHTIKRFECLR